MSKHIGRVRTIYHKPAEATPILPAPYILQIKPSDNDEMILLRSVLATTVASMKNAYYTMNAPHWIEGKTDQEVSEEINSELQSIIGHQEWAKEKGIHDCAMMAAHGLSLRHSNRALDGWELERETVEEDSNDPDLVPDDDGETPE